MATEDQFEKAWLLAQALAKKFLQNSSHYLSSEYQEAEVRQDFIDKLFKALGWDVGHDVQHDPYRREVRIEKPEKKSKGRADYAFSIAPHYRRVRFFVEAKRPQASINTPDNCFQAIRYSWPKGLPIVVLTDFNYLHIIDSRFRPNINSASSRVVKSWHHGDFLDREKFAEVFYLLSRQSVASGSLEVFAETELPPLKVATRQYTLFAAEARDFDEDFLDKLDEWRETLANVFKRARNELNGEELTECVQRTLDRLIFIRFLEDKGIEPDAIITRFGQNNKTHWQDFVAVCKRMDTVYNGVVFKAHRSLDAVGFEPDSAVFSDICDELTDDHSPYNFDSIPVEILGRIYERFLGKVVLTKRKTVEVVEKEDVRKAGGVFYTPDYIVAYMVEQSLGQQVNGKKPDDILKLRVIDTACGSGSFLIGVFAYLVHELTVYWRKQAKPPKDTVEMRDGEAHLTLQYKRQILINCIYGVDIDPQAVEVAQLSLYLKLLEEETTGSAHQHKQLEIGVTLLPSLSRNIVMGNSLVTLEDEGGDLFSMEKLHELKSLDFKAAFPQVFRTGGFDLVIGNPPYIKEYTNREAFNHVRNSPYYQGKMDIWYLFACRGLDWLKPDSGMLALIATNNWVTNAGAKRLREKITRDARIEQLIDFGDYKVFRDAGIQTMILLAKRSGTLEHYTFDYRRLEGNKRTLADVQALLEKLPGNGRAYLEPTFDRSRTPSAPLTFSESCLEVLLDKIAVRRNFELQQEDVGVGIDVHQDFLNAKGRALLGGGFSVGQGIFNLSHDEKHTLHLSKTEQNLVKPFFTSAEFVRYYGNNENKLWVIYTDSRFKNPAEMASYPNLKNHLDQFNEVITSDNHPYGLHRARDEKFFTGEKIISLRKCTEPCFTYTDFPCYVSQTFNIIKTDRINLLYLTALLNSRLVRFWLKHRGKMQGQNFQVDKEPLLAIPLCVPEKSEQERLAKITRRIIECKQKMTEVTTDSAQMQLQRTFEQFEEQLQNAIETLYGLDEQERALLQS
ncbi:MAG: Eco57I restriction-modification methylase domain-containing protein [Methylophilaceae bacterium]